MDKHKKCRKTGESWIMPASYVQKQDTLYVVEHETSEAAKETVLAKIKKLILQDSVQLPSKKLRGFVSYAFLFDFLHSLCKNIRNAWRLSGRR